MIDLASLSETSQANLDKIFKSACSVCDNILEFKPDLLLCLMHSGWGPTFAAQVLWQHTQIEPFPPVARTNIGREKAYVFSEANRVYATGRIVGIYTSSVDMGNFMAWISRNLAWQAQLRQQIEETLQPGYTPERILVVDDTIHEGTTAILTLQLLQSIYPHANVRFVDAKGWFRDEYRNFLFELAGPATKPFPDRDESSQDLYKSITSVAMGSEDLCVDSLDWRPITFDSPLLESLSEYHPAQTWLYCSQLIYDTIAAFITFNAASYTPVKPDTSQNSFSLNRSWCLMRDIFLENSITRQLAEKRYGIKRQEFDRIIGFQLRYDSVVLAGYGRWTRYIIQPHLRRYLEGLEDTAFEPGNHYWVLPGKLMCDQHTFDWGETDHLSEVHDVSRKLLEWGIDCWLDVQLIQKGEPPLDISIFVEEAKVIGREVLAIPVPMTILYVNEQDEIVTKPRRPNRKDIRVVLDLIDQYITQGRVVCVTADESLRGILVGCYLARHGQSGAAALKALQACRATGPNGWHREPPFDQARRYIRSWPAGL
jgi:hypothetical protein